jgi:outer membrane protein OmpA-like peptidoglycan-associated protein
MSTPQAGGDQPQLSTVKIDFVPGERTVFFDDFSDMEADEPPPHWKLRGNPVELRSGGGIRELYAKDSTTLTSPPSLAVPPDFTFELEWTGQGETSWSFRDKNDEEVMRAMVRGEPDGVTANCSIEAAGNGTLGQGGVQTDLTKSVEYALWVQRGRVRAYLNGQRLTDVNQVNVPPIDHIVANIAGYRPNGIRMVRVAESAPDFSAMIGSSGKYVTHGIFFDTDSARLKPESAPVLKMVARGLEKNPNLKLEIDGYTDSVGDAAHNQDLSRRRGEAVRSVLIAQFGVDAARLTAAGFGADKPVASNDTADGRAQNRRAEFVRQ